MATISRAIVKSIKQHGEDIQEYILAPEKYNFFDPGTFLQLTLEEPNDNKWPESRNFSIASYLNKEKTIRLIIRRVGVYTSRIFNELSVGSSCYIKYCFGDFLLPFNDKINPIVCIAGGTGIAPFLSFAECLKAQGLEKQMKLFYSAKNRKELIGEETLKSIFSDEQLDIRLTREKDLDYRSGRLSAEEILNKISHITNAHFYICGGEIFTRQFKEQLALAGAKNIYTDEW